MAKGKKIEWTSEMDALLGTMSDRDLADQLGLTGSNVGRRRRELEILAFRLLPRSIKFDTREADRFYSTRRRHTKKGLPNTLTVEQWEFACEWFDNRCAYCGEETFLTEDHLVPLSEGGPRTALNIIPVCPVCNHSKRAKRAHLWIKEYFGMEDGQQIVDRIVAYLTTVKEKENV